MAQHSVHVVANFGANRNDPVGHGGVCFFLASEIVLAGGRNDKVEHGPALARAGGVGGIGVRALEFDDLAIHHFCQSASHHGEHRKIGVGFSFNEHTFLLEKRVGFIGLEIEEYAAGNNELRDARGDLTHSGVVSGDSEKNADDEKGRAQERIPGAGLNRLSFGWFR